MKSRVDYGHRYKMLRNHSYYGQTDKFKIYRLVLGKKNRYSYAGIYIVKDWNLPDICLYYSDTRRYESLERPERVASLAKDIATRLMPLSKETRSMVILDLGRRKKIDLSLFKRTLKESVGVKNLRIRGL